VIAIVGMAGRFGGAATVEAYWDALCRGVELVRTLDDEELRAAGVDAATMADPAYVRRQAVLPDADLFAARFFGMTPREAEVTDPQQRVFLECAWEALEDAGHDPQRYRGLVGVFGSGSPNTYQPGLQGVWEVGTGPEHLALRVSYKLNLRGPSMLVQTACSSSLTAVHVAVQSLLGRECDLALAGGVSIQLPQAGYHHREGGIVSPDGRCRAFDAAAGGTIGGSGVGVVVLKRLDDAGADGSRVYAVIRGSAVNNDGSAKIGYTAPSLAGQAEAIAEAHAVAGVEPRSITYVEGHGTGTVLGDPVEVKALTQAFRAGTADTGFCALGSAKTNVGHLDAAAGVAGLIKAALAVHHRQIPPTLHYRAPNPACELEDSPFHVNGELLPWEPAGLPLRAGVSAFGVGGTNVHVVLEEAPPAPATSEPRPGHLLVLSAKTDEELRRARENLAGHLGRHPEADLADVAHTLRTGRAQFERRCAVVCGDRDEAIAALRSGGPALLSAARTARDPRVFFLFPGQGSQHAGMGRGLYEHEPVFRSWVDRCCELLAPHLGLDLRARLYAGEATPLDQTWLAQPALFVTAYALARTLMEWGIRPAGAIGHSLGEYVAACVAEVFSLEDALRLVALRGRLMQQRPAGAMVAVALDEDELRSLLPPSLSLAAVNGPGQCVVSGPTGEVAALEARLGTAGIRTGRLRTSHAFHSSMQDPVVAPLDAAVAAMERREPRLRLVSNLTGGWLTPELAADPGYWGRQLRQPVRFADGLRTLAAEPGSVLVEVGPGTALSGLARPQVASRGAHVVAAMRHAEESRPDRPALLAGVARAWLAGVPVDWEAFGRPETRRLVSLPAYPFERERYWIEAAPALANGHHREAPAASDPASYPRPAALAPASAPEGPVQQRVAAVWQELIGTEGIGSDDNFFELGGNSLIATQLLARLNESFGVRLPLSLVFDRPTVAGIADGIEGLARERTEAAPEPERAAGPAPLTLAQEQLWIVHQLDPGSVAYGLPCAFWLRGPLDQDALEGALDLLVRRHEGLRTRFPVGSDGSPVQLVEPHRREPLPVVDLTSVPPDAREARARELVAAEAERPFDLAAGPLRRALLYRLGEREHCLLLLMHHMLADAWSQRVLAEELTAAYGALAAGTEPRLPELRLQPSDVAARQRRELEAPAMRAHLDYWRERLRGELPALDLPAYRPRPAVPSSHGGVHSHRLPPDLVAGLRRIALDARSTPYMTLLAAFCVLLQRYSGGTEVAVGTTVAGRDRTDLERVVANLVNTLAIRVDLAGDPTFTELLGRVRGTVLDAMEYAAAPYTRVVEAVRPARSVGRSALFQALFVLQDVSVEPLRAAELDVQVENPDTDSAQFELLLTVQGDLCHYRYGTDVLDRATVVQLAASFEALLRGIVAAADVPVSRLPVLPEAERRRLLRTWNDTARPYPDSRCVHELFEETAAEVPDALAVVSDRAALTYAELNRRANQLAHHLRRSGVGADDLVGICVERSPEMVVAIYGVLKAGAGYVPVDPGHPPQRIDALLDGSGVRTVLTQERFRPLAAGPGRATLCLDTAWERLAGEPAGNPSPAAAPDNLLYVMFTSGSTGRPKGVMTTHRNVVDVMAFLRRVYRLTTADRVLQHLPHSFDMSDGELYLPLLSGAAVVLAPTGRWDPQRLLAAVREHAVTSVQFVPSVFPVLLEGDDWDRCTSLRHVLSGGDALVADVCNELLQRTDGVVHNFYGPTETTMGMTYWRCHPLERHRIAPIGKPIDNTRTYVLDERLEPVPVGVAGELYIGGVTLARGYLKAPGLTAERFLPDPFWEPEPGSRMYGSGDLARYLPDGNLEFVGRADHQVKLRGYRIEPDEVAVMLGAHPAVSQAVVMVRDDVPGGRALVAYVTPDAAAPRPAPDELRRHLLGLLPEHMVPAFFVVLDVMPLTTVGKVDRRALPPPAPAEAPALRPEPARTPLEAAIAEVWRQVLGVAAVRLQDNFFDLGGHSLLMVQLRQRLADRLERPIELVDLFTHPTVGAQAAHLGTGTNESLGAQRGSDAAARQRAALSRLADRRRAPGGR
jgi:amino acid adenylation domain-containing protein